MLAYLATADDVLRRRLATPHSARPLRLSRLLGCLLFFALLYGATMGTFRGIAGQPQWLLQIVYSAVKVPLLLLVTFAISLPSFFVLNTLLGLRRDFPQALRAVVATQTGLAVVLASMAPFTVLCYASSAAYNQALLFNGAMFAVASLTAQWLLRLYYKPLIARNCRHRWILWGWLLVYMLVAVQLAWLLRPFVGAPNLEVEFLRPEAWDNAYVRVLKLIADLFGRNS
jgi:lysylphosphatidylglycerol synthetase-like protein (DUF2156 family)